VENQQNPIADALRELGERIALDTPLNFTVGNGLSEIAAALREVASALTYVGNNLPASREA
jgi:hypothetical protein